MRLSQRWTNFILALHHHQEREKERTPHPLDPLSREQEEIFIEPSSVSLTSSMNTRSFLGFPHTAYEIPRNASFDSPFSSTPITGDSSPVSHTSEGASTSSKRKIAQDKAPRICSILTAPRRSSARSCLVRLKKEGENLQIGCF